MSRDATTTTLTDVPGAADTARRAGHASGFRARPRARAADRDAAAAERRVRPEAPPPGQIDVGPGRVERAMDATIAGLALLILSPVILLITIAIRVDSKGPILYRQLRIGLDRRARKREDPDTYSRRTADLGGRPFTIYKFRTMHVDAERETGPVWAAPDDERVTPVGRVLRRFRLDEIPQFWNVLRGDMAIVGPRPERPSFVHVLRDELEGYRLRNRVRPGITGWAQVNQEPDQTIDDVRHKLEYDLEYLRRRSLAFDLRIMLRTIPVMIERVKSRK